MNTNQLKRFAKEARIKLLDQVGRKLEFVLTHDTAELRGKENEITQLKNKIQQEGKEQVIEMVAYTWFNRLMALRFMDANGYTIPKVVTPLPGMTNPEILQNALGGNIEADLQLDRQRLNDLLDGKTAATDAHTEAYKMLLVASCNQWHSAMPFMFERISDYTELLLPDDLLSDYSIVADIRNGMSDEDCLQEELIGWLYQFYIADKKDEVFEGLKRNIKITHENIPAATQLFTPRWIVRYMVENTLGKLWLTFKPNSKLRQHMPYYIESPEGNAPAPLPEGIKGVTDITFLDPCQGSGHVLVYAFDLFTKIYEEEGYNTNEIPELILKNNLFGIDIDERAAQLAAFALTMKARSYYPRFLRKPVQPHVIALENVGEDIIKQAVKLPLGVGGKLIYDYKDLSLYNLTQADNYGSLIQIDPEELKALQIQKGSIWQEQEQKIKEQGEYLGRQYCCVVTNPPYMGSGGMNVKLKQLLASNYSDGKSDLFAAFILRCQDFLLEEGYLGMITMESWMFLSSYEELRKQLIDNTTIHSLSHFGWHVMRIAFGTSAFILQKSHPNEMNRGTYSHLEIDDIEREKDIPLVFPKKDNGRFNIIGQKDFEKIPGSPIAYWVSQKVREIFKSGNSLSDYCESGGRCKTCNDELYLRKTWEINIIDIGINKKWCILYKGGAFRKYYGNREHVICWNADAKKYYQTVGGLTQERFWEKTGITWTIVSAKDTTSFRIKSADGQYNSVSPTIFNLRSEIDEYVLLALFNSNVGKAIFGTLNPTLALNVGDVLNFPYKHLNSQIIIDNTKLLVSYCESDWDSYETSLGFTTLPFFKEEFHQKTINATYKLLKEYWNKVIMKTKRLEEENNVIIKQAYGLSTELSAEVPLSTITLTCNPFYRYDKEMDGKESDELLLRDSVKELISYSVGCIFGRFSPEKPGLILANQRATLQDFLKHVPNSRFVPDEDNIVPVTDGEWFVDDITGSVKAFLKVAFGKEHFEENINYVEDAIGKDMRKYLVKDFYNDHIKRYKKRPIYWMFSSPKGHFKAIIYMHRYQPDLCSKLLNDYLQTFIGKLGAKKQSETRLSLREDISTREKTAALKEIDKLELMLKDCREYEKTLFIIATQKINIDLDDGVKVNYQKFKDVLVPIKALEKEEE